MPKRTTDYRSLFLEDLKDPEEAAQYLTAALRDSEQMFLLALRDVAEANQMAKVASRVGVSRESLYRMLTDSGNPTYHNFFGILRALGVTFDAVRARSSYQPDSPVRPKSRSSHPEHTNASILSPITRGQSRENRTSPGLGGFVEKSNPSLPHPTMGGSGLEISSGNVGDNTPNLSHTFEIAQQPAA